MKTALLSRRPLLVLAWLNIVLHVAGLALAAVGIRPGSPLVPVEERLDYLQGSHVSWTLAWITWMFCAAGLIAFLATLTQHLHERAGSVSDRSRAQLGLMIAVTGFGFDLFCDSVYLLVFPALASWQHPPEALFLTVERLTGIASMVIANGAYSLGILLFTVALRNRQGLARFTTATGYGVAGFGLLLCAAGFTGVPWHAALATPPTIGLFCVWVLLVARSLEPAGASS
jgi:hypothetical protein